MTAATSRIIQRALSAVGPWTTIATVTPSAATYQDTGLTNGTEYFYRVIGVNAEGNSAPSNVASATPTNVVVLDTFTAANGTLLTAHSPEVAPGSWQVTGTWTFDIQNGQVNATSTGAGPGRAYIEIAGGLENYVAVIEGFVRDSGANFWWAGFHGNCNNINSPSQGHGFFIWKSGGTWTWRANRAPGITGGSLSTSLPALTTGEPYIMTITADGDEATGVLELPNRSQSYEVGPYSNTSRGAFGFQTAGFDGGATRGFDSFEVSA